MMAAAVSDYEVNVMLHVTPDKYTVNPISRSNRSRLNTTVHNISKTASESDDSMPFLMMILKKRLHLLPVVTAIFILVSFVISYIVAVSYGHVEPFFPYISYTAIEAPERCLFAQLINVGALMLGANVYIRYKHMATVLSILTSRNPTIVRKPKKLNLASLFVGILSAFGLTMVANFQTIDMRPWHYTGASIAFFMGCAYCWLQTAISLRFRPWSRVTIVQVINSVVLTIFLAMFTVSKIVYKVRKKQGHGTKLDTLQTTYLISTISEWLTAMAIVTFVLTFYHDFKNARLHSPRVSVQDEDIVLKDYHLREHLPTPSSTDGVPSNEILPSNEFVPSNEIVSMTSV